MHVIVQGYGENQIYFFQPFFRHVHVEREVLTSKKAIGKKRYQLYDQWKNVKS